MDQQHEFSDLSKLDSLEDKNSLLKWVSLPYGG
jgi:hypothetical protein